MATDRIWTFKPRCDADARIWLWEASDAEATMRSQRAFENIEECWADALRNGFEVPHPEKPWEGYSVRMHGDGSLTYSPL